MAMSEPAKLILPADFSERDAVEIKAKGWFTARVQLSGGNAYTLNFYDPVRLEQEVSDMFTIVGRPCYAEPGLVIVPEVTVEAMKEALPHLVAADYFSHLLPT
jgi:hypothetical protein